MSPVLTVKNGANENTRSSALSAQTLSAQALSAQTLSAQALSAHTSISHRGYESSLRDQFRGALMGLALVPMALQIETEPYHQTPFAQLMQAIAPGLLRYHHHWQHRTQWLNQLRFAKQTMAPAASIAFIETASLQTDSDVHPSQTVTVASPEAAQSDWQSLAANLYPQLLLIGDWLEMSMTNQIPPNQIPPNQTPSIDTYLSRYQFSTEQAHQYRQSHLALQKAAVFESYALSVQTMNHHISQSSRQPATALKHSHINNREKHALSPFLLAMMGLWAGANVGIASLPLHWQMGISRANRHKSHSILTLAERIYGQWAGELA
ncbi:MAG: hypothetical protein AB8B99_06180 [Phormidesmis sp.]